MGAVRDARWYLVPPLGEPDGRLRWLQLIPPVGLRHELMHMVYAEAAGHLGPSKTIGQVTRRAYWKGWRTEVQRFCKSCEECNRYHRDSAPRQGRLQDMVMGSPWERVGLDLTEKHPRSRRGNHHLLAYVNHFTKFAEAVPIPNKQAETVCMVLAEELFSRFEAPLQLPTSKDANLLTDLCGDSAPFTKWIKLEPVRIGPLPTVLLSGCTEH